MLGASGNLMFYLTKSLKATKTIIKMWREGKASFACGSPFSFDKSLPKMPSPPTKGENQKW
jgi:hypothetical protein